MGLKNIFRRLSVMDCKKLIALSVFIPFVSLGSCVYDYNTINCSMTASDVKSGNWKTLISAFAKSKHLVLDTRATDAALFFSYAGSLDQYWNKIYDDAHNKALMSVTLIASDGTQLKCIPPDIITGNCGFRKILSNVQFTFDPSFNMSLSSLPMNISQGSYKQHR